jgi:integrase
LKQALGQAVKWELLTRNPADAVDPPRTARGPMNTYDLDQTAELIEAMRPTRMLVPTLLAGLCGMRRGEIAALRWKNVNLSSGQLAVLESAEQMGSVRYKTSKKGSHTGPVGQPCGGIARTTPIDCGRLRSFSRSAFASLMIHSW